MVLFIVVLLFLSVRFKRYIAYIDKQEVMVVTTLAFGRLSKIPLSVWLTVVPLAICLVYSLFYVISSLGYSLFIFSNRSIVGLTSILSPSLDFAVWGVAIFVILARLGYDLELNVVKG